jgi:hypothetical protein
MRDVASAGKILVTGYIGTKPPAFSTEHSEQFSEESMEQLQVRTSSPDIPIGNEPVWGGAADASVESTAPNRFEILAQKLHRQLGGRGDHKSGGV